MQLEVDPAIAAVIQTQAPRSRDPDRASVRDAKHRSRCAPAHPEPRDHGRPQTSPSSPRRGENDVACASIAGLLESASRVTLSVVVEHIRRCRQCRGRRPMIGTPRGRPLVGARAAPDACPTHEISRCFSRLRCRKRSTRARSGSSALRPRARSAMRELAIEFIDPRALTVEEIGDRRVAPRPSGLIRSTNMLSARGPFREQRDRRARPGRHRLPMSRVADESVSRCPARRKPGRRTNPGLNAARAPTVPHDRQPVRERHPRRSRAGRQLARSRVDSTPLVR